VEKKRPEILNRLRVLLQEDTAGDPMGPPGLMDRQTTCAPSAGVEPVGLCGSVPTRPPFTGRIGYAARHPKVFGPNSNPTAITVPIPPYNRQQFSQSGYPIISVDTKKKEW